MSPLPDDELNPYQAPQSDVRPDIALTPDELREKVLRRFRQQRLALGAAWSVLGGVVTLVGFAYLSSEYPTWPTDGDAVLMIMGFGVMWILFGLCTCCRQQVAVRFGLAMSYLALAVLVAAAPTRLELLFLFLCGAVPLFGLICQAHRVLRWAKELEAHDSR